MRKISTFILAMAMLLATGFNALQAQTYCSSGATSTSDSMIDAILLDGETTSINSVSTGSCATYTDYTAVVPADLILGQTYDLVVTLGTCGGDYNKGAKAFIDWNADFDFEDAGEEIGYTSYSNITFTATISFTVPMDANLGNTRLRIIGRETTDVAGITPCATFSYGETEDYTVSLVAPEYCESGATNTGDSDIDAVVLQGEGTGINNNTAGQCAGYSDFTALTAPVLIPGSTYDLVVTVGTCGGDYNKGAKAYIDWNQDYDLTDAGEEIGVTPINGSTFTTTLSFTVPTGAIPGETRLRVVGRETSSVSDIQPCGTFTYGETEDYTIEVASAANCDLTVSEWLTPGLFSSNLSNSEIISFSVTNVGLQDQTGFTVAYSLDNGVSFVTETVNSTVVAGATYTHTFATPGDFSAIGDFTCVFQVNQACDANTNNNSDTVVVNNAFAQASFPYFESFDTQDPHGWVVGGGGTWQLGTPTTTNLNSASSPDSSWVTNLTGNYNASENSWVESPLFDMSSLSAPILEVNIRYYTENNYDGFRLEYTTDGGQNWNILGQLNDPLASNWYNSVSSSGPMSNTPRWTGNSGDWLNAKYNIFEDSTLTAELQGAAVKFRFRFAADGSVNYEGVAFDDFALYNLPQFDAKMHAIIQPAGQAVGGQLLDPIVVVRNLGMDTITTFTLSYQVDGGTVTDYNYVGEILPTAYDTITLAPFTAAASGVSEFKSWVTLANDPLQNNDTLTSEFEILPYACNYAMSFNGIDNWIEVLDDTTLNSTDYTIEAWIKPNQFSWLDGIVSRYQGGGYGWTVRLSSSYPYNKVSFNESDANYILNTNEWYHIAAVNEAGVNTLYINGIPYAIAGSNLPNTSGTIGIGVDYSERWWNGLIDEVKIWKTALTATQINDYMILPANNTHPAWNDLAAYYDFNQPAGLAYDSKNDNHGIIHGANFVMSDLSFICEDDDAYLVDVISPAGQSVEGDLVEPIVVVQNLGFNTITAMTISYQVNGGSAVSYNYSGSILSTDFDTISLPAFTSGAGLSDLTVWVDLLNDPNQGNDTLTTEFDALPVVCNYAMDLDGDGQYAALPSGQYFGNNFTVEAWVYKRSNNYSSRLIDFSNGENADNIIIQLNNGSTSNIRFSIRQGSSEMAITSNYVMPLNQWVHIAVSYDGVAGRIYVNGVENVNGTMHNPLPVVRDDCWIGRSAWSGDDYADVLIDEFKIWNATLLPATIAGNLYSPATAAHPNFGVLAVYYDFNSPISNPIEDLAGINDLSLFDAAYSTQAAPVVCDPYDASITGVVEPIGTIVESSIINPVVLLTNLGVQDLTAATIYYSFGADTLVYNYSGIIFLGQTDTVTLGDITVPGGTSVDLCVWVELVNDANPANDQYCETYTIMENACNYAFYMDGSGDYISIPVSPETEALTNVYTLETWIKPEEFGFLDGIISKYHNPGQSGFSLRMGQTSPYNVINFDEQNAGPQLSPNQWYHIAAVNNNGLHKLYVNGVEYLSSASATYSPNNTDIRFGVDYGDRWFKGYMDEVRIWNAALTGNDIQAWMQQSINSTHPEYINLVGYWTFDDLAPVATDLKAYHDGIIHNGVYKPSDAPIACGTTDVGVVAITEPVNTFFQGNYNALTAEVFNYGTDTITSMDILYEVDGGAPVTYAWTGTLAPLATVAVNLPPFIGPAASSAIVTVWTDLTGDLATFNNAESISLTGIEPYEVEMVSFEGPQGGCGLLNQEYIQVLIQNNGDSILNDLVVNVMSLPDSTLISELVMDPVLPLQSFVYTFTNPVDLYVGTGNDSTFEFTAWLVYPNDADMTNNQIDFSIESVHAGTAPLGMDTTILFGTSATLYGTSANTIYWFEQEYGGSSIHVGDTFITPVLYDTTIYWIESSAAAAFEAEIGTGTSSTGYNPTYGYYDYSWSKAIYTAAEIGNSMEITSIWYYVANTPANYTMNNQKVYMKHNAAASFTSSSTPDFSAYTEVFSGNITWNGGGWREIVLTTPFNYNGIDNLEIGWTNNDGSWSSGYPTFRYSYASNAAQYRYQDGSFPTSSGNLTGDRANLKLTGMSVGCPSERVPVSAYVTNIPNYDVSVNAIISPTSGFVLSNCETVSVEITNWGSMDVTSIPLTLELNSTSSTTEVITTPLLSGETMVYTFNPSNCLDLSAFGTYDLCVSAAVANDAYPSNDTICVTIENNPLTYCNSTALYNSYIEVVEFKIGSWSNFSGPAMGMMYSDFTTVTPTELIIGQSAITYVKPEHYSSSWDEFSNYKIYIDYNMDGVFDPITEMAFGTNVWGQNGSYGQITIPQNATPGTTGMRLVFNRTNDAAAVTPCGTYSYGETEDYMITLLAPVAHDAGITEIIEPSGFMIENNAEPVQVRLQNFGTEPITTVDIVYTVDGVNPVTYTWTGNLAPFTNTLVDLQPVIIPALNFDFCAFTQLLNDGNTSNDTLCMSLFGEPQYQAAINQLSGLATGCDLGMATVSITFTNQADTIQPGMLEVHYHANGFGSAVTESITEMILPGTTYNYTFNTPFDQTVTTDTEIEFVAWIELTDDPYTNNDSITFNYWSSITPDAPVVSDQTIFANEQAVFVPVNMDSSLVYTWYNEFMSQMATGVPFTTPALIDTTLFKVRASTPANQGACVSDVTEFYANVEYADFDAAVTAILQPATGAFLTNAQPVEVEVYNNGLNAIHNFQLGFSVNGISITPELITDTIQPGDALVYAFTATADLFQSGYGPLADGYGEYDVCAYTLLTNDGFNGNDTLCVVVENQNGDGLSCETAYPYGEVNDPAVYGATTFSGDAEWYEFTATTDYTDVIVSLCGSSFDTKIEVFDLCGNPYIAYNDDNYTACGGLQSQVSFTNLAAGSYFVKVYGYGSSFGNYVLTITGNQVAPFTLDVVSTSVSCNGQSNGSVDLTVNNIWGQLPFSFAWSDGSTSEDLTGLVAGTYFVTVSDAAGNEQITSIDVEQPDALVMVESIIDVTSLGGNDGSIALMVTGGVEPYAFDWSHGATTDSVGSLYGGSYQVTLTDANQCEESLSFLVDAPVPAGWDVTPTSLVHNIYVPHNAPVTLDLSPVTYGSYVGVFYDYGGVLTCGGYFIWTGNDITMPAYGATSGQDNGFQPNEAFVWKVYEVSEMDVFNTTVTYETTIYPNAGNFVAGGLSGLTSVNAVSIVTQTIVLPEGWSLWSTYVYPTDPDITMVLQDITWPFNAQNVSIVKDYQGGLYWPGFGINTIGDIDYGEGYQIRINSLSQTGEVFTVTGLQIIPEDSPINIPLGWGIISYLRDNPGNIETIMAPVAPMYNMNACVEIMKNSEGQLFWPGFGINTIGNMIPGEGYQTKNNCTNLSFTYPSNSLNLKDYSHSNVAPEYYSKPVPTGNSMTIGIHENAWEVAPQLGDEIGVFNEEGNLVGSAVYEGGFTAFTVWGQELITPLDKENESVRLHFELWRSNELVAQSFIVDQWGQGDEWFAENKISIAEAISYTDLQNAGDSYLGQNYPNPFKDLTVIPFFLNKESKVKVSLFNLLGEEVKVLLNENRSAGYHNLEFKHDLPAGNYYYQLSTDDFSTTKSMSIQ